MNRTTTEPRAGLRQLVLLAGVIVLAGGPLSSQHFQATEMFTLRDSLSPRLATPADGVFPQPLVVGSFRPLDEFELRLLPAVFRVLAVPALA
jgi:hypothetical protein